MVTRAMGSRQGQITINRCVLSAGVSATALLVACGLGRNPVEAVDSPPPSRLVGPVSTPECSRVHVSISGANAAAAFSADSACGQGVAVISGGSPSYIKNQRRVTIPVRVVNRAPGGREAPIWIRLEPDSAVVVLPTNVNGSIAAEQPDSIDQGVWQWLGQLDGEFLFGDTTASRNVVLTLPNKTTAARLTLGVTTAFPDSVFPPIEARVGWAEEWDYIIADTFHVNNLLYRRVFSVQFSAEATGYDLHHILNKYNGEIIGGRDVGAGFYAIRFPDPGSTWPQVNALRDSLMSEPGVAFAAPFTADGPALRLNGRFPNEGAGIDRQAWIDRAPALWALWRIHAPSAWGCSNGVAPAAPTIAFIEASGSGVHADANLTWTDVSYISHAGNPDIGQADISALESAYRDHSAAVTSIAIGKGDNGIGATGVAWGAPGVVYGIGARNFQGIATGYYAFEGILRAIATQEFRVVVSTVSMEMGGHGEAELALEQAMRALLTARPDLLWIQSSGDLVDTFDPTSPGPRPSTHLSLQAILARLSSEGFADQILIVTGSNKNHGKLTGAPGDLATDIPGFTALAAPAEDVLASLADGSQAFLRGTSAAAPLVGGVAALILAQAPGLSAGQVRQLLLDGAETTYRDSTTGQLGVAPPLSGFQGVVRDVDAFGSLRLAAALPGTAFLCGHQIIKATLDSFLVLDDLSVVRAERIASAVAPNPISRVSISPGGRKLSFWLSADSMYTVGCPNCWGQTVATTDVHGTRVATINGASARYDAERVYAVQRLVNGFTEIQRVNQQSGVSQGSTYLTAPGGSPIYALPDLLHFHPDGRFMLPALGRCDLDIGGVCSAWLSPNTSCDADPTCTIAYRTDLSGDGSLYAVDEIRADFPTEGDPVYTSRVRIYPIATDAQGVLSLGSPIADETFNGVLIAAIYFGMESRTLMTVRPSSAPSCVLEVRPVTDLQTVAGSLAAGPEFAACPDVNDATSAFSAGSFAMQ